MEYKLSDNQIFDISIGSRVLQREVNDSFDIPVYSANVFQPFGYIDRELLTDYSKSSIVWGIDGNWQVNIFPDGYKFYPTDHCGVLRINSDALVPRYVAYALMREGEKRGFKRSYRASLDRIKSIAILAPDANIQVNAVKEVNRIECILKKNNKNLEKHYMKKKNLIRDILG